MRKENLRLIASGSSFHHSLVSSFDSYSTECLCLCVYWCACTPSRLLGLDVFTTVFYFFFRVLNKKRPILGKKKNDFVFFLFFSCIFFRVLRASQTNQFLGVEDILNYSVGLIFKFLIFNRHKT